MGQTQWRHGERHRDDRGRKLAAEEADGVGGPGKTRLGIASGTAPTPARRYVVSMATSTLRPGQAAKHEDAKERKEEPILLLFSSMYLD